MTDSNNTPSCYANTSTPYYYAPEMGTIYFSATFSALGLTSNLVAFIVLIKSFKQTQNRSQSFFLIFLGGLVVTDFMGLLVTGSFVISFYVTHVDWRQSDTTCHFCNFMGMSMVFYGLCPLLLGATMAIERFIGINHPFARSSRMSKSRTISMVLMVWFIAGSISLLPLTGFGSYHIQTPGSWCFINVSSERNDWAFSLLFSFVGLISITASFLLNTVSVVTLIKVCCGSERRQRRRDHEVEMMVQLILIMTIATVCWCPLLVFIAQTALAGTGFNVRYLLLWIRFATWNQILDPWVYILFRRSVLKKVNPRMDWSRSSVTSLYPSLRDNVRRFTRSSLGSNLGSDAPEDIEKSNAVPPSTTAPSPPSPCLIGSES
ncbi:thromboxane A2 receptor isoform X1 [Fundulus heteroclitus]|uniref:Thromboxane A2 receptor n=1 Tax=Fundulus heteroclitus TaxID=8078 RepID=A0A3Q2QVX0_FUNHE|nr:thromboxane A2 receptor isoform X1 [Fundulus heteroclitus]XP_012728046.1 thromboxane A2 receptor isoform X1 [Fundulus heteroclitus]XP_021177186.1 thromboxane A2 receptor isoform X1 [Fundulus heteroclitus]XP_021177187.1 thromboxane A2 receptor isoform X1 [Fundulus heteroclitus]XP_035996948.1 thromboxane A2 receptor isoform X1 [Fundulus heteroclitus]